MFGNYDPVGKVGASDSAPAYFAFGPRLAFGWTLSAYIIDSYVTLAT